jgi:hypothetical protein
MSFRTVSLSAKPASFSAPAAEPSSSTGTITGLRMYSSSTTVIVIVTQIPAFSEITVRNIVVDRPI